MSIMHKWLIKKEKKIDPVTSTFTAYNNHTIGQGSPTSRSFQEYRSIVIKINFTIIGRSRMGVGVFFVDIKGKCVCLLCRDTLSIFKRGNIERHYRTKHADFDSKFPTHSSLRQDKLKTMKLKLNQEQSIFKNPNKLAQNKKPFSDGELIKEAFKEASDSLFTDFKNKSEIVGAISSIQLSSNTVVRRIEAISSNQKTQLQTDLSKCSYFSLQMDESNDIIDTSQLSIFIRMFLSLTGRTREEDIYKTFKQFVEEEEIPIEKLAIININNVMELVVKIVNSIRGKVLKRRLFRKLMDEVNCHYGDLLLHSNVRWLSKGKVLHRFKELLPQIKIFLQEIDIVYEELENIKWLEDFAFLHFPTLQEIIINYSENIYEPTNHINIIQHLLAQFISNPFTGDVKTKANEIGNLFNFDKIVLEMEIITLQNDSILKITSEFWKHANSNLDSSLRVAVSNYIPQFSKLAENQCPL
ncbi:hypothetical protein QTP88_019349 [Uroleucon formosanum]